MAGDTVTDSLFAFLHIWWGFWVALGTFAAMVGLVALMELADPLYGRRQVTAQVSCLRRNALWRAHRRAVGRCDQLTVVGTGCGCVDD